MKKLTRTLALFGATAMLFGAAAGFVSCSDGGSSGGPAGENPPPDETPKDLDPAKSVISFWGFNENEIDLDELVSKSTFQAGAAADIGKQKDSTRKIDATTTRDTFEVLKILTLTPDLEIPATMLKGEDSGLKFNINDGRSFGLEEQDANKSDKPNYRINRIANEKSSEKLQALATSEALVYDEKEKVDNEALRGCIEISDPRQAYVANVKGPFKVTMYYGSNSKDAKTDRYQVIKIGADYATAEEHAKESEKNSTTVPLDPTKFSYIYKGTDTVNVYFGTNTAVARIYGVTIDQNEGYADAAAEDPAEDELAKQLKAIEDSLEGFTFTTTGVTLKDATVETSWADFFADADNAAAYQTVKDAIAADKFDATKYPQIKALMDVMPEDAVPKTKYDELSEAANNLLKENFVTAKTVSAYEMFGTKGNIYASKTSGAAPVKVAGGVLEIGASGGGGMVSAYLDFGIVTGEIEGYFEAVMSGGQSNKNDAPFIGFMDGDSYLAQIYYDTKDVQKLYYTLNGSTTKETASNDIACETSGTYKVYYKFDTAAKTFSLEINEKKILENASLASINGLSGIKFDTHNSGKSVIKVDNVAVCGTEGDVAAYKAQVKAWLDKTHGGYDKTEYTTNGTQLDTAKSDGETAIDGASDIAGVQTAYKDAVAALKAVKNDLQVYQASKCEELDAYFPTGKSESNYTGDKLTAVNDAKTAGKTAINAATTNAAVDTALANAKTAIDALPDNNTAPAVVTIKDIDGTSLGTIDSYVGSKITADEVSAKVTVPDGKKIEGYYASDKTTAFNFNAALTGATDVVVKFEDKPNVTASYSQISATGTTLPTAPISLSDTAFDSVSWTSGKGSAIVDATNNVVVIGGDTIRNNDSLAWISKVGSIGQISSTSWEAKSPFPASTEAGFATGLAIGIRSTRYMYVYVSNCKEVKGFLKDTTSNQIEINVYEVSSSDKTLVKTALSAKDASEQILDITGLNKTKSYMVEVVGNRDNNTQFNALAFYYDD